MPRLCGFRRGEAAALAPVQLKVRGASERCPSYIGAATPISSDARASIGPLGPWRHDVGSAACAAWAAAAAPLGRATYSCIDRLSTVKMGYWPPLIIIGYVTY
jgi:hypothetical protein